jgi:hypothetical protein
MSACHSELAKIAASTQARPSTSAWSTKTIGAPRSKLTGQQAAKAPTIPSGLNVKIVAPGAKFGPRQNYSQPYEDNAPSANPTQVGETRNTPPPNVVFGAR